MNAAEEYGKEMSEIHAEAHAVAAHCLALFWFSPASFQYQLEYESVTGKWAWFFWR